MIVKDEEAAVRSALEHYEAMGDADQYGVGAISSASLYSKRRKRCVFEQADKRHDYSFPALAVYNAGAALYRSIGKTRVTMNISIIANVINVAGNLIGVFWLRAGVAYPSLSCLELISASR